MSTSNWVQFIRQCIHRRICGDEFRELVEFMNEEYQIPGTALVQIIVDCRQTLSISSDPLIPQYVRAAITSGLCQTSDVLFVLIQNWNSSAADQGLSMELKKPGCLSSPDSQIINDLALVVSSHKPTVGSSEIQKGLSFTSRWLIALGGWISQDGENRSYVAILALLEALGILFDSMVSTAQGILLLGVQEESGRHRRLQLRQPALTKLISYPDLKSLVAEALETILPLMRGISGQLHSRLDMIQRDYNLFRAEITKELDVSMQNSRPITNAVQFEANNVNETSVHARASLYIYMDAAVSAPSPAVELANPSHSFLNDLLWMTPP